MIVTVGEVSVRLTLIDGKTGRPADGVRLGPKSRLTPFTSRTAGRCLDLSVTRVGGSSWDEILSSGGLRADRTAARSRHGSDSPSRGSYSAPTPREKAREGPELYRCRCLSAGDSEDVSVFMSSSFLVAVDHRLGRAARPREDQEGTRQGLSLTPVIQAVLGLSAPDHGALMLHAASVALLGGRLFIGGSGAGKSTIAGSVGAGDGIIGRRVMVRIYRRAVPALPHPVFSDRPGRRSRPTRSPSTHVLFLEQGGDNQDRRSVAGPGDDDAASQPHPFLSVHGSPAGGKGLRSGRRYLRGTSRLDPGLYP